MLWKGCPPPVDWRSTLNRHTGIALCYLLFHTRRLVTEHGGLRPNIECLQLRTAQRHVMDLWQRIYHSLPATLLPWFRAPPLHQDLPCASATQVRVQRFPQTQIDSALLPDKGLSTNRAFRKHASRHLRSREERTGRQPAQRGHAPSQTGLARPEDQPTGPTEAVSPGPSHLRNP